MTALIAGPDGVFVLSDQQYAAWSRRVDRGWLVDQLDTRPRAATGTGLSLIDTYRWPGFPVVPSADVPPFRADGAEHAAPRVLRGNAHDGAGEACSSPHAGPRPVSLQAIGRIMRLTWPWSSR